jgi:tetratricopeptide (TPR) repeat protein
MRFFVAFLCGTILLLRAASGLFALDNPRERIDFWRQNYAELTPDEDPRAARAQEIFRIVLNAAGHRSGVVPRLYILKKDPHNAPFAIAIPDGWVILSRGALDLCYRKPELGDDRLAFVLAHEIAHQLKNDFWHMMFFTAIDAESGGSEESGVLKEIREIAESTEKVLAKELQADEYGIVYASMAGFDTGSVVSEDVNFFEEWVKALDPERIEGMKADATHPTSEQRAETVKARLRQVLEKVALFDLGVHFYQAGHFEKAAMFFEEFLRYFPSREVYHNIAACHHQLALKAYREMKGDDLEIGFKLTVSVDPETRASDIGIRRRGRGETTPEERFRYHMDEAIANYETAVDHDPSYVTGYDNLGCAYILNGEYFKAIATLKDAAELEPENLTTLNNLGVAFYYAENPKRAREMFEDALARDPAYEDALYNLGRLLFETDRIDEAREVWTRYLRLDGRSGWALAAAEAVGLATPEPSEAPEPAYESVLGLEVGMWEDEVPADWLLQSSASYDLAEYPFVVNRYTNGVVTVSQDDEIIMAYVEKSFRGESSLGIDIGSAAAAVRSAYGVPSRVLAGSRGESLVYTRSGISFVLQEGVVTSWMIYFEE